MQVETTGYVGFGISPNGKMWPSDVVIGWVTDRHAFFSVMCSKFSPTSQPTKQIFF